VRPFRFFVPSLLSIAIIFANGAAWGQPAKPDAPADPGEAEYAQHMQNGVKLYELKHYGPALVEFQAAYKAKPKASPLVNEALCLRELFRYPEAVSALERALAETHDPLDAANRKAAEDAIGEMRPLIAYVELSIDPPDAKVTIDGDEIPKSKWSEVELPPNEHTIVVERDGWKTGSSKLTIASGEHKKVTIALKTKMGTLHVLASKKDTAIEVDNKIVGSGDWTGPLEEGDHTVRIVGQGDATLVKLAAGETTTFDKSHNETVVPPKPPVTPKPTPKKDMGAYVLVEGGGLYPTRLPVAFTTSKALNLEDAANNFGALGGLHVGYRVNTFAAFEGIFQYSNVTGGRHKAATAVMDPSEYSFSSYRLGPMLRLMSPGKIARFVGTIGGGFVFHSIRFQNVDSDPACTISPTTGPATNQCVDGWGVDFFASTDAGVEFSIGNVLIGLSVTVVLDSTKGTEDFGDHGGHKSISPPYGNDSLPFIGPLAHFGYAFW
jgi:hypothetical protein